MAALILFGAGASYGSKHVEGDKAPPLGIDLFRELALREGIASSLPDGIKNEFVENFEVGMAKYYEHSNGNIMTFQREMAEYLASLHRQKVISTKN